MGTGIAGVLSLGLAGCGQISEEVQRQFDESTDSDGGSGDGESGSDGGGGDGESGSDGGGGGGGDRESDSDGGGGGGGDRESDSDGGSGDGESGGNGGSAAAIEYGETHQGVIDDGDGTAPGYGGLADAVTFEGETGESVEITMTSGAFDTYLVLQAPDGSVVAQNDDRQQDFNSEIVHTLTQSGTYTAWCSSFSESATGAYQLTLEKVAESAGNLQSISYGETKNGTVDESDGTAPEYGGLAEAVTFQGEEGDTVEITMTSEEFDTYLVLQAPDGSVVAQNDDRESDVNSRIRHTLSQSGTYTAWCSSFSESATGPYQLTLQRVE